MKFESTIEASIVKAVKQQGGLCLKMSAVHFIGMPDRLVILPFKPMFFVEVKRPGQKPSKIQLHVHRKLRSLGVTVLVIDNVKDFINEISAI
mgnify:CR=1 FL=1